MNIDADLIQKGGVVGQGDDSLVPLQNGCICCTLKMDLVQQIEELLKMSRFDYIVIEASGICEPMPIAQTICSIPMMGPEFCQYGEARLDSIVSVVDAMRLRDEFGGGLDLMRENIAEEDIENLVIQQIEFCNKILLNKASEVTPSELERTKQILRALQPKAEIIECDYCDVELTRLLDTNEFDYVTTEEDVEFVAHYRFTPGSSPAEPNETKAKHKVTLKANPSKGGSVNNSTPFWVSPVDQSPVAHIIGPHSYLRAHSIGACSAQSGFEVTRRRVVAECHPAHLLLLIIGCQRLVGVDVAICEGRLGTHHSAFVVGPVDKAPCCRRG